MTANEWRDIFVVAYEKITSNGAPDIEDAQLSILFTNAQLHFVQTRISTLNTKKEGLEETEVRMQGLSGLVTDSDDPFNSTNPTSVSLDQQGVFSNYNLQGTFWDLPQNFMYAIYEDVTIDKIDCTTDDYGILTVDVVKHDEIKRNSVNPFKKPYWNGNEGTAWRVAYQRNASAYGASTTTNPTYNPLTDLGYSFLVGQTPKRHELITDGSFSITDYKLRFLKIPKQIVVDITTPANQRNCELDASTHLAIINIAVDMAKEALNQPNTQIIPNMQQVE
jgi:hypothetical protein